MKYPLLTLCALALTCSASEHAHSQCSGHDHAAEHKHEHAAAEHGHDAHSQCSGHDHAAEHKHEHTAAEHGHDAHSQCSGHDHAAEHKHEHTAAEHGHDAHSQCSGHDHAAEHKHEHTAAEHGHDAHSQCSGHDHAAERKHDDHSNCSGHDHGAEGASGGGVIMVQADARSRHILNMQVEEVPATSLALTHSLYGYLTVPEHATETYALPCAGRISLRVKSAQQVHKGDILYTVEAPAISEQITELQKIEANIDRCTEEIAAVESRVARLHGVGTRNSDLEEQLKFKKAELGQLTREEKTAKARLRMLAMGAELEQKDGIYTLVVKAEKEGTVRNVGISQGSWGEQGAAVITMTNVDAMEIVGTLYGSDMPRISEIRAIIPVGRENVALKGTWRLAEQVDAAKQTRSIYFTPESLPAGALAGKLCRLDLYDSHAEEGTVSIPDTAVVKVGVDDVVFVEVGEGQYAMLKVRAGESRRGMTPVSGLTPGQKIVVKGGYELKYILPGEGQKKKAGHFHADGKFHEGEEH
ncbi:MAG: efflux RND transporter periplasmic adaptor subunit [Akkermansia sp.]|nr:efflux RND transporter periplasmic adaptor subunit [Akkermansia sp.]